MTDQTPAQGWYRDNHGTMRWWDGRQWTEHTQNASAAGTDAKTASVSAGSTSNAKKRRPWLVPTVIGAVAFFFGVAIGAADTTVVEDSPEYQALADKLDSAGDELDAAQEKAAKVTKVDAREAGLDEREAELDERSATLKSRGSELDDREKAVGIQETEIKKNTITDGLYEVGVDMKPGQYKRKGSGMCYYAVLNSSDTFDIANNNNVSGPATVSVAAGQYFESKGCGEWVRQ